MVGQQLWLSGFEPNEGGENLFLALAPPPAERTSIFNQATELREALSLRGKLRPKACLHVSLINCSRWRGDPASLAEAIDPVMVGVGAAPFVVTFDYAMSFSGAPNRRPFVLRSEANNFVLRKLRLDLVAALKAAKIIAGGGGDFQPHVTLLYDNQLVAQRAVVPVSWTVRDIVLVRSPVGQSRHVIEGRWPLAQDVGPSHLKLSQE